MNSKQIIVVVSGGFDPLHSGHISYLNSALSLGHKLVVCLNSDQWLIDKKKVNFLTFKERKIILENLSCVHEVIDFEDDQMGSCVNGLEKVKSAYPNNKIIFCNGGDRNKENIPEMSVQDISFEFSVGGDNKMNSSSDILNNYLTKTKELENEVIKISAPWGEHITFHQGKNHKIKELRILPNSKLSLQFHNHRSEHWVVVEGIASIIKEDQKKELNTGDYVFIQKEEIHRIENNTKNDLRIVEIQEGKLLEESDIVRIEDSYNRK